MAFKKIPIAQTINSTLTDFPLYVKPSAISGWSALTLAEAKSLRFYADEAKTTELPREVVNADGIHVKKTTANGDNIYADYDGVRSDYADTDTYGRNNVWTNAYEGVLHLNADPTQPINLITNPSSENFTNDFPDNWLVETGDFTVPQDNGYLGAYVGSNYFLGGDGAENIIYQDIDLFANGYSEGDLDAGKAFTFRAMRGNGFGGDPGSIILEFLDSSKNVLSSTASPHEIIDPEDIWVERSISDITSANTQYIRVKLRATLGYGSVANVGFDELFLYETAQSIYTLPDATGNGNNALPHGGMTSANSVAGKLAGTAISFDGIDDFVTLPKSFNLEDPNWTVSMWFQMSGLPSTANDMYLFREKIDLTGISGDTVAYVNNTSNEIQSFSDGDVLYSGADAEIDTWYYLQVSHDNGTTRISVNGGEAENTGNFGYFDSPSNTYTIFDDAYREYGDGRVQEIRLSSVTRSADWDATEYANQNDPATFFGTVTDVETKHTLSVDYVEAVFSSPQPTTTYVKINDTFQPAQTKVKVNGSFVDVTPKVKQGGSF